MDKSTSQDCETNYDKRTVFYLKKPIQRSKVVQMFCVEFFPNIHPKVTCRFPYYEIDDQIPF